MDGGISLADIIDFPDKGEVQLFPIKIQKKVNGNKRKVQNPKPVVAFQQRQQIPNYQRRGYYALAELIFIRLLILTIFCIPFLAIGFVVKVFGLINIIKFIFLLALCIVFVLYHLSREKGCIRN
jgi:hypothetical protein